VRIDSLSPMMARSLIAVLPKTLPVFPMAEEDAKRAQAPPAPASAPATSVQMLVMLGAVASGVERRRRMARDAERGLDTLDRLNAELLSGTAAPSRLREIAAWSANLDMPDDPVLASIQSEIDLRVRVELAKFDIEA
jgi:hypothetical protein